MSNCVFCCGVFSGLVIRDREMVSTLVGNSCVCGEVSVGFL